MPQSKSMTSVRIDDDLLAHIDMVSKETHIKKGAIINKALRYYFDSDAAQQLLESAGEDYTTLRIPDINNVNYQALKCLACHLPNGERSH